MADFNTYRGSPEQERGLQQKGELQEHTATSLKDTLENTEGQGEAVNQYLHDMSISKALSRAYGGNGEVKNPETFYEENEHVFVPRYWEAKIFKKTPTELQEVGKTYYDLKKQGDFYIGTQVKTANDWKVKDSESYFLIDKVGNELKQMRGTVWYRENLHHYCESYRRNGEEFYAYYDDQMNLLGDEMKQNEDICYWQDDAYLFAHRGKDFPFEIHWAIVKKGQKSDSFQRKSQKEIEGTELYQSYIKQKQKLEGEEKEQKAATKMKEKENYNLFQLEAKNDILKSNILDQDGKLLREKKESDPLTYKLNGDYDRKQGFLILSGIDNNRVVKRVFINGETGFMQEFEGAGLFVNGKTLSNFINGNDAKVYDLNGNYLGFAEAKNNSRDNVKFKIIITPEGNKAILEEASAEIKAEKIEDIVHIYHNKQGDSSVLIVRDANNNLREVKIQNKSN